MLTPIEHRSDAELIAAAQTGDTRAFGEVIGRHQRAAIRVAAVALGSPDGADDVAQEAFVKMYKNIHSFRSGARIEPWLFRIVTNTARNQMRHEGRQRALRLRAAARVHVGDPGPDEIATQLADRDELIAAINRLAANDRIVLTLKWYEQLSEAEIAEAMECRPGTVKSRLSRAMDRLRAELGES